MNLKTICSRFNRAAKTRPNTPTLGITDCKYTEHRDGYEYCEFRFMPQLIIGFNDYGKTGTYALIDTRSDSTVVTSDDPADIIARLPDCYIAVREWSDDGVVNTERTLFANYQDALDWVAEDKNLVKEGKTLGVYSNNAWHSVIKEDWTWDGDNYVADANYDDYIEWSVMDGTIHKGGYHVH